MALRLISWIASQGGVRDPGGDIRHTLGRYKDRPGLVSSRGKSLDDMAIAAWEAGYFPLHRDRPDINDLLDAIAQDHLGRTPVWSERDDVQAQSDVADDPALVLLARLVSIYRTHGEGGKRKAMRPLLREAETLLQGVQL